MFYITQANNLTNFFTAAQAVNVALPESLQALRDHTSELDNIGHSYDLAQAAEELSEHLGNISAYDKARSAILAKLNAAQHATELDGLMHSAAENRLHNTIRSSVDDMLKLFTPPVQEILDELHEAATGASSTTLSITDTTTPAEYEANLRVKKLTELLDQVSQGLDWLLPPDERLTSFGSAVTVWKFLVPVSNLNEEFTKAITHGTQDRIRPFASPAARTINPWVIAATKRIRFEFISSTQEYANRLDTLATPQRTNSARVLPRRR